MCITFLLNRVRVHNKVSRAVPALTSQLQPYPLSTNIVFVIQSFVSRIDTLLVGTRIAIGDASVSIAIATQIFPYIKF